jgi:hypothetical protein
MAGRYDALMAVLAIAGLGLLAYSIWGKGGATDQATAAGQWVADQINKLSSSISSSSTSQSITTTAASLQTGNQIQLTNVPATPAGMSTSNWVWTLSNGTQIGLPAGMTPLSFAQLNPDSPISAEILAESKTSTDQGQTNAVTQWLANVLSDTSLAW